MRLTKAQQETLLHDAAELSNVGVIIRDCGDTAAKKVMQMFGARYLIRGLRNNTDYQYEEMIAKNNRELCPDIRTMYFRAEDEIISSSFIKILFDHDRDITKYVPDKVAELMWRCGK